MNNVKYRSPFSGQEVVVRVRQARSPYVDKRLGKIVNWGGRPTVAQADIIMRKRGFMRAKECTKKAT